MTVTITIGGGYTGVSTALNLAERGFDVVLLEARRIGWGASGRNGGHVGTGQRAEQDDLEKMFCKSKEYSGDEHVHAHNFWVPLIGLYTGMRLEEICQCKSSGSCSAIRLSPFYPL